MVKTTTRPVPRYGVVRCPSCAMYLPRRERDDECVCSSCYVAWSVEGASW